MNSSKSKILNYRNAGVDIDKGNLLVDRIKPLANRTRIAGVVDGLGGFGALFDLAQTGYKDPVLVSGTDGVGTKLKLAILMDKHDTIGIDLVAMCVNDLLAQGAQPLFFLDYFACAVLDVDTASTVISGIAKGCELAGCALIGGETAEMPGMYQPGDYDLAGFCVGAVERDKLIDGSHLQAGNVVIGIASSGLHSNGFSLVRKIVDTKNIDLDQTLAGESLANILLEPTCIYVEPVQKLMERITINALAHITGGGLVENIPRVIPDNLQVVINNNSWKWPPIFSWLQQQGNIDIDEMYRTFNCGVGMVICIDENNQAAALDCLAENNIDAWEMGIIQERQEGQSNIIFN